MEGVGGVDGPPQLKPGQQRTRVMLAHSSPTASLDGGKDRGRRVREQGSRGETKSGGEGSWGLGGRYWPGWGGVRAGKSDQVHKFGCGAVRRVSAHPTLSLMEWLLGRR